MEHNSNYEQLPSGKSIARDFDGGGLLVMELHSYGVLEIAIKYDFKGGAKVAETYFAKRRMVSRRVYEKARTSYTDMPPADSASKDWGADLLRGMAREQRHRRAEAKQRRPDPLEARKCDAFCSMLMEKGKRENASTWIQARNHTLGERNWTSSRRLIARLLAFGCVQIYACEIDVYEDGVENTGHLVIELPTQSTTRSKILKAIDRLASETGYNGGFDDGQRYAYVKLD